MTADPITIYPPKYGVGDQVEYMADKRYPDGTKTTTMFVGSLHGAPGPVVMIWGDGSQTFVDDPGRFGEVFDESWVRRFLTRDN